MAQLSSPVRQSLGRVLRRGWPTSLFGRLALLLVLTVVISRVLVATLVAVLSPWHPLPTWVGPGDLPPTHPLVALAPLAWRLAPIPRSS